MKDILILGGTGAMGALLVEILNGNKEYNVLVTSRSAHSNNNNIKYIKGNARDPEFMNNILSKHYDVIVDFMNYGYQEFLDAHNLLLKSTNHYIFLSSSRVYASSYVRLIENSPRLLDVSDDAEFLSTQRYALRKARQEDILKKSGYSNYTIVRPYITYSSTRLQLGIYEKENWLYRVLNDKPILITNGVLNNNTTLTYGYDVSLGIFRLIEKNTPCGDKVHITTNEYTTWGDIIRIYQNVIKKETGKSIRVFVSNQMKIIEDLWEGGYNTKYDRLYNRTFNNEKAEKICGHIDYISIKEGLTNCLTDFINRWKKVNNKAFLPINWEYEAFSDLITNSVEDCKHFPKEYLDIVNNPEYSYLKNIQLEKFIL